MTPQKQLAGFLKKFTPDIAQLAREALEKMRARMPGAVELVYDNYNALVIAFAPSERASEAIFSIALYPRWITLFFAKAPRLPDPKKLLQGNGKGIRHIVVEAASDLELPGVRALMTAALKSARPQLDPNNENRMVIKAVSEKQRARRPAGSLMATKAPLKRDRFPGRRPR